MKQSPSAIEQNCSAQEPVLSERIAVPQPLAASVLARELRIPVALSLGICLVHLLFNGGYGYFRDELYYAACGEHLAWGYVDHAPLIAVVARVSRWLLGDRLYALRLFPALASGAKVFLTGWMVRELGGGRTAQALAATGVFVAPIFIVFDNFLSMNAFEPVFWMGCAAIALHILNQGNERLWLLFGVVAGLGLLNKHSMLLLLFGVFAGLLVTSERKLLANKWVWLASLVALGISLPNLIWEMRHGWPLVEVLENSARLKNAAVTPVEFIFEQTLLVHPLATPTWLAGLYFYLRAKDGRRYRFLGWSYLVVLGTLLVFKGRIYYLAPAYPMLFAAGGVWLEKWTQERNRQWLNPAMLGSLAAGGLAVAPLALPVLPVEAAAKYARFWRVERIKVENHDLGKLPQLFADMFGWENQVATVARVYSSLPAQERSKCAILAGNYGEASAIDYFGRSYGLPKAISGHNSYYLWGPRNYSGEVVISIGLPLEQLRPLFGQIEQVATIKHEYAMPDENDIPVFICRAPRMSLQQAWPRLKEYG